jgi:hypothetical protein
VKVAILIGAGFMCAAHFPAQDQLRERLDAIYARGGYERELPSEQPVDVERKRDSGRPFEPTPETRQPSWELPGWLRDILAMVVTALPWLGLAVVVALLVVLLVTSSRTRAPRERPVPAATPTAPTPGAVEDAFIPDHARLAAEGRFEEAIHALLLLAIQRLRATARTGVDAGMTSREIARGPTLGPDAREALGRIVRAVEITLFGGRPAGEHEYRSCAADLAFVEARP